MLDWHSCQICYLLEIKVILLLLVILLKWNGHGFKKSMSMNAHVFPRGRYGNGDFLHGEFRMLCFFMGQKFRTFSYLHRASM